MNTVNTQESLTERLRKTDVQFPKKPQRDFLSVCRERVAKEMEAKGAQPYATKGMWLKTIFIVSCWILFVGLIYSDRLSVSGILFTYACIGFVSTLNGLNIAHDANHSSYSKSAFINWLLASFFDLNGTSSDVWRVSHNEGHHIFTNIPGKDTDVDKAPSLRLSPGDKLAWFHRYQNLYAPLLYAVSTMNWVFYSDYVCWYDQYKKERANTFSFFFFKITNLLIMLVIPAIFLSAPFWVYFVGLLLLHAIAGITSALVFQMGHVVEGVEYIVPDQEGNLPFDWAVHEMRTTSNFSTSSRFVTFWVGGLNFQIEHHLFPNVCHVHYHWIGPIVEDAAKEFNLPYNNIPTFKKAIASHFRLLKRLGTKAQWTYARPSHLRTRD